MTISTITSRVTYVANGATTEFAVPFPFYRAEDIAVVERLIATGAETTKEAGTDYSVSGGNGATGAVTAVAPPPSTVQWVIRRVTPLTQEIDYVENDPFPAETHEEGLDRAAMRVIDMQEQVTRAPKFPLTDPASSLGDYPNSVERISKALTFDSAGKPTATAFGDLSATFDITISGGDADKPVMVKTDETGLKVMDDAAAARAALGAFEDVFTTRGDMLRAGASGAEERLALGTAGQILKSDGTDAVWGTGGKLVQQVIGTDATYRSITSAVPSDDSLPQNTEGTEVVTVAITPTSASSTLRVRVNVPCIFFNSVGKAVIAALFRDSTADAKACGLCLVDNFGNISFMHEESAGSTNATTFKLRIGQFTSSAGTIYLNGNASSRLGGTALKISVVVEEIAA